MYLPDINLWLALTTLKSLAVGGPKITRAGIKSLQKSLPKVKIFEKLRNLK
jgi:hypothetical protein